VLAAVAAVFGLVRAVQESWVSDDAYITFRYAENLAAGHGLVFNVGERVEGYTNFLWTVLLSGVVASGGDPIPASLILGVLGYAATLLVVFRVSRAAGPPAAPLAVTCVALHADHQVWATGGLETSWVAALFSGAAVSWRSRAARGGPSPPASCSCSRCCCDRTRRRAGLQVRPSSRSPARSAGAACSHTQPRWYSCTCRIGCGGPGGTGLRSEHVLREVRRSPVLGAGPEVLAGHAEAYPALMLVVPAVMVAVVLFLRERRRAPRFLTPRERLVLAASLLLGAHLLYVARVGGDFMFARS